MKKVLAFVLSLCMLLPLVACGNNGSGNSGSGTAGNNGDDITAEHPITMVVAHDEVLDSPQQRAMEAFKEYVEAESGGRIVVELHANGELGDAATMANMIGMGSVQASSFCSDILATYNDKLSFLCLPFLFDDYEQAVDLVWNPDGELHKLYQEEANKAGYYILGFQYDGQRGFSNNVREVLTAEDMKGLKVRVMQSDISVATFTALGCNVTPMSFSEVYTALQQNVVEGQDNPASLTLANKFNEVQKYYSTIGHNMNVSIFVTNKDWLESLPDDLREIVLYAGEEFGGKQKREETRALEEADLKEIDESGCKVTRIEDKSSFIEATQSVYDQFRGIYGDEFMDTVLKAVGKA